jgi:hypothetical protein
MSMPEATHYIDYCVVFGQHNIWFAWQVFNMQAESESLAMQETPHDSLGLCISAANAAHHAASGGWIYDIDHGPQA